MPAPTLAATLRHQLAVVERRLRSPEPLDTATAPRHAGTADWFDVAQETTDRELTTMSRSRLLALRLELTSALERLADGRYGVCEDCEGPIPAARLRAMPSAAACVPCQTERERVPQPGDTPVAARHFNAVEDDV